MTSSQAHNVNPKKKKKKKKKKTNNNNKYDNYAYQQKLASSQYLTLLSHLINNKRYKSHR